MSSARLPNCRVTLATSSAALLASSLAFSMLAIASADRRRIDAVEDLSTLASVCRAPSGELVDRFHRVVHLVMTSSTCRWLP